jgi:hypothetical protein
MEFTRRHFLGAAAATAAGLSVASCVSSPKAPSATASLPPVPKPEPQPLAQHTPPPRDLPPLIAEALAALEAHSWRIANRDRIGVVDFSLPSREPRFHVVDAATGQIERSRLVAHGSGSDPAATGLLHRFSNQPGSNATSRGAYLTADTYYGKHGRSQRLVGLDPDNDMAMSRAIVIHGADYVDPSLIARQGRIGRSQGCFAFEEREVATVMELLGEGRMIYASKLA